MLVTPMMVMNNHRAAMMMHDDRTAVVVNNHRTPVVHDDDGLFDRRLDLPGKNRTRRDRRGVRQTCHHAEPQRDGDDSPLKTL
jgi:hypothetical protein